MRRLVFGVMFGVFLAGCGDGDAASDPQGADSTSSGAAVASSEDGGGELGGVDSTDIALDGPLDVVEEASGDTGAPTLVERPETGVLTEIEPGGETLCARGTPFRFFVYGADPTKVVIDFQGGGACWNEFTCGLSGAIFSDSTGDLDEFQSYRDSGLLGGIYDFDNPDNPFYGWTLVHIPYCTGDIHWGDATVDYTDELTIHHRGYRNVTAVLDWVSTTYPEAERVVSTGCSAGAYGAIGHAPTLAEMYPDAQVTVVADGGSGVITDDFLAGSFPNWNAEANMPMDLEGIAGKSIQELGLVDFYIAVADAYPEMRVAQHTTAYDKDQIFYYTAMGGQDPDWNGLLVDSLNAIRAEADNFRYYLAPGPIHCIHPYDIVYSREVDGIVYRDWLRDLVDAEAPPEDVVCSDDCRDDPLCAGCLDGSLSSSACHWCDGWEP